jgi:hypothetical protein
VLAAVFVPASLRLQAADGFVQWHEGAFRLGALRLARQMHPPLTRAARAATAQLDRCSGLRIAVVVVDVPQTTFSPQLCINCIRSNLLIAAGEIRITERNQADSRSWRCHHTPRREHGIAPAQRVAVQLPQARCIRMRHNS